MEIESYLLIGGRTPGQLASNVQEYSKIGYECVGSMSVVRLRTKRWRVFLRRHFIQPMAKYAAPAEVAEDARVAT